MRRRYRWRSPQSVCDAHGVSRLVRTLAALGMAAVLSACGSSTSTSDLPEGAEGAQPGSGCEEGAFSQTLDHIFSESDTTLEGIESFECTGDWALVTLTLAPGSEGVDNRVIFKRDADAWILKAPETVCGTVEPGGSRPADAEIIEELWAKACTTS
jgi:hypothetical protein